MNWFMHLALSLIAGFLVIYFFHFDLSYLIFVGIGALLPDIDIATSKIRQIFNALAVLASIAIFILTWNAVFALAFLGIWFVVSLVIMPRHRGLFHSHVMSLVFGTLAYFATGNIIAGAFLAFGYSLHLIEDLEFLPIKI